MKNRDALGVDAELTTADGYAERATALEMLARLPTSTRRPTVEDGEFRELAAMSTDPVCGMPVESNGPHSVTTGDRTWWFCSAYCREEFLAHPALGGRVRED